MKKDDLIHDEPAGNGHMRVAWPFYISAAPLWRSIKRAWPKAQHGVTQNDMVAIFAADLKASNDIMVKHHRETRLRADVTP